MTAEIIPILPPPAAPVPAPIKPGYQTTEFWMKLLAYLLTLLFASGAITDSVALNVAGMAASVLGSLGYTVGRSIVKASALKAAA